MLFSPMYIMMVGLPGSGKSTMVTKLVHPAKYQLLSTDAYITMWADQQGLTYNEGFKSLIGPAQENFYAELKDALFSHANIVHDQTNLTVKKRASILSKIPNYYYKVACVVTCSERERQIRLGNRPGKVIPVDVDKQMIESFIEPTLSEGFHHVQNVHTSSTFNSIW
jgi:tRNA uridine 5-carbamoylmethylation protein Kti12